MTEIKCYTLRKKCPNTVFFFNRHFAVFELNTEIYGVNLRIQFKYGRIRTRKTPYLDIFHTLIIIYFFVISKPDMA